jgi:hypothetical protein
MSRAEIESESPLIKSYNDVNTLSRVQTCCVSPYRISVAYHPMQRDNILRPDWLRISVAYHPMQRDKILRPEWLRIPVS